MRAKKKSGNQDTSNYMAGGFGSNKEPDILVKVNQKSYWKRKRVGNVALMNQEPEIKCIDDMKGHIKNILLLPLTLYDFEFLCIYKRITKEKIKYIFFCGRHEDLAVSGWKFLVFALFDIFAVSLCYLKCNVFGLFMLFFLNYYYLRL